MAATLTPDGELTFFSFPIEKSEETADGDLLVYGKATDGTVDSDLQIVDPEWSGKAIQDWLDTGGNLRVQHQARRDPAGRGVSIDQDPGGDGTWVKALVVEPVAKDLVRKGVLTCYSVGISLPDIVPDPTGKAMNGIIRGRRDGLTKISELSLVDRGSNFNSKFQIAKSAGDDGHVEFVGKMMGETELDSYAMVNSPKPSDVAKVLARKNAIEKAVDPNVGGGVDRDKLPDSDFAGPNRTYPIHTPKDVHDAGVLIGHAADQDAVKAKIKEIAARKGPEFEARIPDSWKTDEPETVKIEEKPTDNATMKRCPKCNTANEKAHTKCVNCGTSLGDAKPLEKAKKKGKCPTCKGKGTIMGGNRDCPDCDGKKPEDGTEKVEKKAKVICQGCGANHDAKHGFCPECGKKVAGTDPDVKKNHKFTCLKCSADLDKGEKFCPGCGKANPGFNELKKAVRAALKGDDMDQDDDKTKPDPDDEGASATDPDDESADDTNDSGDDGDGKDTAADDADKAATVKATKKATRKAAREALKSNGDTVTEAADAKHVPPAKDLPPHREPDGTVVAEFEGDADMPENTVGDDTEKTTQSPEMAVLMRYKSVGISTDLGAIHDLTCPCYDPQEASKCFPYFDLNQLDDADWQQKAFDQAASAPLAEAQRATRLWQHAVTLKSASPDDLLELRHEAHKAFADANPGPGMAPSPTQLDPKKFNRPYLAAGHAAASPGQEAPNKAPMIGNDISAEDYTRGFLSAGHAADSPSNKGADTGVPSRAYYTNQGRDNARQAMTAMHDHIAQTFPGVCQLGNGPATPGQATAPTPNAVPVPVGTPSTRTATKARSGGGKVKPLRKQLEKAVLKGIFTIEEAQALLAKTDEPEVVKTVEPEVTKAAVLDAATVLEIVTKAVGDAVAQRDADHLAEVKELQKAMKKQGKMLDAIAAQPDPVAPYRGVALMNSPRPGAEVIQKSSAERSRENLAQLLYEQARRDPDPSQREVAWAELNKMAFNNPTSTM